MQHSSQGDGRLSWHGRIGYGSGDYALNLFWQGVGFYLFFYYTDVLGLPNKVAGTIFAICGIWDAVSDPIMGYIAERSRSKWGIYRPYLLFGAIPLALSFILLFNLPFIVTGEVKLVYIAGALLIFRTCYTIVSIPYSALSACLTYDSQERTRISGIRMYCCFLGGLTVIGLATILQEIFTDKMAFSVLSYICGIVSVGTFYYCFKNTKEQTYFKEDVRPASSVREIFSSLIRNKPFIILTCALMFVTICSTVTGKMMLYYFEYDLKDRLAGNMTILMMAIIPLLTIPIWSVIAIKWGKKVTWQYATVIAILGLISLYLDRSQSIVLAQMEFCLINVGTSAYAVLLWSMLPDTIDYGEFHTAVRNESSFVGILSSAQKIALAGTAFILGFILDDIGYIAGAHQSKETLNGLNNIISLIPIGALILSFLCMHFYPLSAKILSEHRNK